MSYLLSTLKNSYDTVQFDHAISYDYKTFLEGGQIIDPKPALHYYINKKKDIIKLQKSHLILSTGPELVSASFRKVIEQFSDDVDFFDVIIKFEDQYIDGFFAMYVKNKICCIDMDISEYKLTNFDPANPTYQFYYMVVKNEFLNGFNIVRCKEMPVKIVVSEKFKTACFNSKLSGIIFCSSLDMTYNNRTVCESINV